MPTPLSAAARPPRLWPAVDITLLDKASLTLPAAECVALWLDDLDVRALESAEEDGRWRAFFETMDARDEAFTHLTETIGACCRLDRVEVEDEGWALRVQESLRAVTVGRVTMAPPWDVPPPAPAITADGHGPIVVVIEPSMGFGTGHHQSTRLCVDALQRIDVAGKHVVDVGTGSGVLAITACRLGARHVVAFDNDPDSVAAASANVRVNHVEHDVEVVHRSLGTTPVERFDVVLANLTVWLLQRHTRDVLDLVRPGGTLVLSGFTADQVPLVNEAFNSTRCLDRLDEDDWTCLTLSA